MTNVKRSTTYGEVVKLAHERRQAEVIEHLRRAMILSCSDRWEDPEFETLLKCLRVHVAD